MNNDALLKSLINNQDKMDLIEAYYRTSRAEEYRLMTTFCDILQQEKRLLLLEDKIEMVYDTLVDLSNKESSIKIDFDRMERVLAEFREIKEFIESNIKK